MGDIANGSSLVGTGTVNFGLCSDDYATYRPGFPPRFFDKICQAITDYHASDVTAAPKTATAVTAAATTAAAATAGAADTKQPSAAAAAPKKWDWAGKHVLDLGTGPGIVALEVAARGAAKVVGVDIAANQIAAAEKRAKELKLDGVASFAVGTAEETKQASGAFDVVLAGQCWPWFKPKEACAEIRRVLKPGGVFVIGQFCYHGGRSPVAYDTESLVLELNPKWTMARFDGLYPKQVDQLVGASSVGQFELCEQFAFDHPQYFTHDGWRGRMRTCNGVGSGGLDTAGVAAFDDKLSKLLTSKYPVEPVLVWHRVWGLVVHV